MRVLGIDPGSHRTGWGVVDCAPGKFRHVASGTLSAQDAPLPQRLLAIAAGLDAVLVAHAPEVVAIESIFHAKNVKSALLLGHARGVALLFAAQHGLAIAEYAPAAIKKALTGSGRADKTQVQSMVHFLLGHDTGLELDASDALAGAICHAQLATSPVAAKLEALVASSGTRGRSSRWTLADVKRRSAR